MSASLRIDLARLEICTIQLFESKTRIWSYKSWRHALENCLVSYHKYIQKKEKRCKHSHAHIQYQHLRVKTTKCPSCPSKQKSGNQQMLAFPGFKSKRDTSAVSYPASCAAAISASFSTLIVLSFASRASAISSKILLLSWVSMAYDQNQSYYLLQHLYTFIIHSWFIATEHFQKIFTSYRGRISFEEEGRHCFTTKKNIYITWSRLEHSRAATAISRAVTSLSTVHLCASWWKTVPIRSPWSTLTILSVAYPLQQIWKQFRATKKQLTLFEQQLTIQLHTTLIKLKM